MTESTPSAPPSPEIVTPSSVLDAVPDAENARATREAPPSGLFEIEDTPVARQWVAVLQAIPYSPYVVEADGTVIGVHVAPASFVRKARSAGVPPVTRP